MKEVSSFINPGGAIEFAFLLVSLLTLLTPERYVNFEYENKKVEIIRRQNHSSFSQYQKKKNLNLNL